MLGIIIPIYHVEDYLEVCIRSVYAQSGLRCLPILVCDSKEEDASFALALELLARYNQAIVLQKSNGGLSSARNAGMDFLLRENAGISGFKKLERVERKLSQPLYKSTYKSRAYGEINIFITGQYLDENDALKNLEAAVPFNKRATLLQGPNAVASFLKSSQAPSIRAKADIVDKDIAKFAKDTSETALYEEAGIKKLKLPYRHFFYNDAKSLDAIYLLDSDDFLLPNSLSVGMSAFSALGFEVGANAMFLGGQSMDEASHARLPLRHAFSSFSRRVFSGHELQECFLGRSEDGSFMLVSKNSFGRFIGPYLSWGALFSKGLCERVRFIDGVIHEGCPFAIEVLANVKNFYSLNLLAYVYRTGRSGSIMSTLDTKKRMASFLEMARFYVEMGKKHKAGQGAEAAWQEGLNENRFSEKGFNQDGLNGIGFNGIGLNQNGSSEKRLNEKRLNQDGLNGIGFNEKQLNEGTKASPRPYDPSYAYMADAACYYVCELILEYISKQGRQCGSEPFVLETIARINALGEELNSPYLAGLSRLGIFREIWMRRLASLAGANNLGARAYMLASFLIKPLIPARFHDTIRALLRKKIYKYGGGGRYKNVN